MISGPTVKVLTAASFLTCHVYSYLPFVWNSWNIFFIILMPVVWCNMLSFETDLAYFISFIKASLSLLGLPLLLRLPLLRLLSSSSSALRETTSSTKVSGSLFLPMPSLLSHKLSFKFFFSSSTIASSPINFLFGSLFLPVP